MIHASLDPPRSGEDNMALDQEMLERAEREQVTYLRLYRWSEPTLSLGHFQQPEQRGEHAASSRIAMVRRASGGGAIVHDCEWTYAIAMPQPKLLVGASQEMYDLIHDRLTELLRSLGWPAFKWNRSCSTHSAEGTNSVPLKETAGEKKGTKQPFLCFDRRSCGDIVIGEHKVVGSAQRRLGSSVLQHGSILLCRSAAAPELSGILDLPRSLDRDIETRLSSTALEIESILAANFSTSWLELGEPLLCWIQDALTKTTPTQTCSSAR